MNPKRDILENYDLLLEDDRIAGIVSQTGQRKVDADKVLNCQGKIIIPGLVSAHSHLTGIFQRGLWNEFTFEDWLSHSSATERIVNLSAKDIYTLHCAACIEFLRHGVTTVLNMFTLRLSLDLAKIESATRAFADTGIRGILALMLKDQSLDGEKIVSEPTDYKSYISFAREVAELVAKLSPRITFMLAPSAPQWCSDQLLVACRELADELSVGIHTHLLETRKHAELGRRLYGQPMVKHLEKIEFLNPKLSVAHGNWLEEAEIDILKKHDVKVIHNPSANMKLGSGVAQVKKMLRTGLTANEACCVVAENFMGTGKLGASRRGFCYGHLWGCASSALRQTCRFNRGGKKSGSSYIKPRNDSFAYE
jgi:cytosine/adenosine deaminase-related metal-dependent hydrolase